MPGAVTTNDEIPPFACDLQIIKGGWGDFHINEMENMSLINKITDKTAQIAIRDL